MDVPAHVTEPTFIENHVEVQGGTNWDISRSAVETPITQLAEPEPVTEGLPSNPENRQPAQIFMVVHFSPSSTRLPPEMSEAITKLPPGAVVGLRSYSSGGKRVALQRREAVRAALVDQGFTVLPDSYVEFEAPKVKTRGREKVEIFIVKK
jgi:hypothetical protein